LRIVVAMLTFEANLFDSFAKFGQLHHWFPLNTIRKRELRPHFAEEVACAYRATVGPSCT
jgi:hypothetical protein